MKDKKDMKTRCLVLASLLALALSTPSRAQLAPANDLGVSLGHIHVAVKDVEAQKRFWTEMLGGALVTSGPLTLIQFPGIFIMLRQADAAEPSAGTVFDHFGFVYKDIAAMRARWKAAGVKYDVGDVNPNQGYVFVPDSGIRIEVFGDPSLPGPVSMDHVHLYPPEADIPAMQAWYAKVFGGFPGSRQRVARPGVIQTDYFHRFNFSFSAGAGKLAGTRGRAIDHMGFEVKDIADFEKKLAAHGLAFDAAIRQVPNTHTKIAFLTDPWGTYIEVTEGLAP